MTNQKDYRIELYRFAAAVIILFFHGHNVNNGLGHPIQLGHVFVEFFFFLSGYFTYAHIYKKYHEDKENLINDKELPLRYTWNKIKRLIPYMSMTLIFYFVLDAAYKINHGVRAIDCLKGYSGAIFDYGLLQITGICKNPQFNAWWYLSALLFTLPIVVMLFKKTISCGGYRYTIITLPLIIYGWFALTIDGLDWETSICFTRTGFFRGLAGLCMGANIFCLAQNLAKNEKKGFCKMLLTLAEIISYAGAVWISYKAYEVANATFLIVFLLITGLIISFSNQTYTTKLNLKMFSVMGEVATPLYICHYSIGRLVGLYLSGRDVNVFNRYLIYLGVSIVFAGFMLMVHKFIKRRK